MEHTPGKPRLSAFELAELSYAYQQIAMDLTKQPLDYGTGELYTPAEVHTVTRIELHPGITATQIADATMRTKSAVSQIVARLEDKGLVRREKDPGNGRQQFLYATDKGLQLSRCHRAFDEAHVPLNDLVARFGPDAVDQFADMMVFLIRHGLNNTQKHNSKRNED